VLALSKAVQYNFYSSLANAGILSKMINVGFFENASGNAAGEILAPIIKVIGPNSWGNQNIGDGSVNGDGVNPGGSNGTGLIPGILGTDFPSDNNAGATVYAFTGADVGNQYALGYTDFAGTVALFIQINNAGVAHAAMWNDTSKLSAASPGAGYYSVNRTGAAALDLYYAKAATPHASIASSAAAAGSRSANSVTALSINVFPLGSGGLCFLPANNRIRLVGFHQGLTALESLAFYNCITSAITFLGQSVV
jgi:hypothetical protein